MHKKIKYIDIDLKQDQQVILLPGVNAYWDFRHPPNELKNIYNLPFDAASLFMSKEFQDTNKVFETPSKIDTYVKHFMNDEEIKKLAEEMQNV